MSKYEIYIKSFKYLFKPNQKKCLLVIEEKCLHNLLDIIYKNNNSYYKMQIL